MVLRFSWASVATHTRFDGSAWHSLVSGRHFWSLGAHRNACCIFLTRARIALRVGPTSLSLAGLTACTGCPAGAHGCDYARSASLDAVDARAVTSRCDTIIGCAKLSHKIIAAHRLLLAAGGVRPDANKWFSRMACGASKPAVDAVVTGRRSPPSIGSGALCST